MAYDWESPETVSRQNLNGVPFGEATAERTNLDTRSVFSLTQSKQFSKTLNQTGVDQDWTCRLWLHRPGQGLQVMAVIAVKRFLSKITTRYNGLPFSGLITKRLEGPEILLDRWPGHFSMSSQMAIFQKTIKKEWQSGVCPENFEEMRLIAGEYKFMRHK